MSDSLNHKLSLLINFNSLCSCSNLKALFKSANSPFIINGILKRISKSASRGILDLHVEGQRGLTVRGEKKMMKYIIIPPKMRFIFRESEEKGLTQRNYFSWSVPIYWSKGKRETYKQASEGTGTCLHWGKNLFFVIISRFLQHLTNSALTLCLSLLFLPFPALLAFP